MTHQFPAPEEQVNAENVLHRAGSYAPIPDLNLPPLEVEDGGSEDEDGVIWGFEDEDGDIRYFEDVYGDTRLDEDDILGEELPPLAQGLGIPLHKYQPKSLEPLEQESCCICLENYVEGDENWKIDCGHEFHFICITKWLQSVPLCPICKGYVGL